MNTELDIQNLKDELRQVNNKLTSITGNLDQQQKNFEDQFIVLASLVEAISIIRYYTVRTEDMTCDDLKYGVISCLESLEDIRCSTLQPDLQNYIHERQQFIFGALLDLAKRKRIMPGELLNVLKEQLDAEGIEAIVNLDEVCRVFGTAEALNWKNLLLTNYSSRQDINHINQDS